MSLLPATASILIYLLALTAVSSAITIRQIFRKITEVKSSEFVRPTVRVPGHEHDCTLNVHKTINLSGRCELSFSRHGERIQLCTAELPAQYRRKEGETMSSGNSEVCRRRNFSDAPGDGVGHSRRTHSYKGRTYQLVKGQKYQAEGPGQCHFDWIVEERLSGYCVRLWHRTAMCLARLQSPTPKEFEFISGMPQSSCGAGLLPSNSEVRQQLEQV